MGVLIPRLAAALVVRLAAWAAWCLHLEPMSDPQPVMGLPIHRTEAGWPRCSTCDGGGCPDCTDPA